MSLLLSILAVNALLHFSIMGDRQLSDCFLGHCEGSFRLNVALIEGEDPGWDAASWKFFSMNAWL